MTEEDNKTETHRYDKNDVERGARDIIDIERKCFYGDESQHNRLKKIREKLNNLMSS